MGNSALDIWESSLLRIRERVNKQSFETWFKPTKGVAYSEDSLIIQVPNQFFCDWLEEHYLALIEESVKEVTGVEPQLSFTVPSEKRHEIVPLASASRRNPIFPRAKQVSADNQLNPRYRFDTFVVGSCNQFAQAASLAVAEAPGRTKFNPLVIYGGVGLGKTHIIQAIGNFIGSESPSSRLIYVSSERFTIEFINSIQNNKTSEFSQYYRNVDVLLVDDIHFFINKERTQEEFFHTFNTLHQEGKQIVLTSDRPPRELKGLEERLISRVQWGLVTDIQQPDLETRIAILQKKAEEDGLTISNDVISFIASKIVTNIRELEGSLIRLLAFSSITGSEITIDLAREVLKDTIRNGYRQISIESIQRRVCQYFSLPEDILRAKTRKKEVVLPRQIAMYLSKKMTNHSLKSIGLHFGGRDHSTVIYACQTVEREAERKYEFKKLIDDLTNSITVQEG
ncbi:MAG: chromosomal replication initiator protein DnaA [bacterium]